MKKICVFLALIASLSAYGQQSTSSLRFDEQAWDFGTVREIDGKVSHIFNFTNTGDKPVVIEDVEVSCGCTSPSFSRAPVMPGKKGSVTITYDPKDRPGAFLKEIAVRSDKGRNIIKIKGNVTPRPRTTEDDYPFEALHGVRLTTGYLNFDRVGQGEAKSMTVGYINTSPGEVELRTVAADNRPWFRVTSPGKVCAGCKGEITLTFDLTGTVTWGTLNNGADIYINGDKNGYRLQVNALATDNFDGADYNTAPKSKLDSHYFHFGDVASGKRLSHDFTIENTGGSPLIIRAVQCSNGATSTLRDGTSIKPGGKLRFTIAITANPDGALADRVARSVMLVMNDPIRPMHEIRLVANIIHP